MNCFYDFSSCAADEDADRSETQLLNKLLLKVDPRIRPNAGG